MKRIPALLALLVMMISFTGCSTTTGNTGANADPRFLPPSQAPWQMLISRWQERMDDKALHSLDLRLIKDFQQRIAREGWSNEMVVELLVESQKLTRASLEIEDHWDTPQEFVAKNFEGDCEDIAIFMLATLRTLGYPHQARVLAAKTMFADHALLKVEMPDNSWQVFETTRAINPKARLAYTPIVEFDEKRIIFAQNLM